VVVAVFVAVETSLGCTVGDAIHAVGDIMTPGVAVAATCSGCVAALAVTCSETGVP
jgi:hypothetical protein